MELRQLRYFLALADTLHFGRAASKLRISQPSLSQQIGRLEAEVGSLLLSRTSRRVELTEAGRAFLAEAREALAHVDRAALVARRGARSERPSLRVGLGHCMDAALLARVAGAIARRHPGTSVELHTLSIPLQVVALREGRLDVGLVRPSVAEPSLAVEVLCAEPLVVALPASHRLASRKRLELSALAREAFALVPRTAPVYHDLVLRSCREAGFVPTAPHEADHLETLLGLVAAGIAVALVPICARKVVPRKVVLRSLRPPVPMIETAAAWRRREASPEVEDFLAEARRAFRSRGAPGRSTGA